MVNNRPLFQLPVRPNPTVGAILLPVTVLCRAADIWIVAPADVRILLHFRIQDRHQPPFRRNLLQPVERLFNVIVNGTA